MQSDAEPSQSEEAVVACPSPHATFPALYTTFDRLVTVLDAAIVIEFVLGLTGLRVLYKQILSDRDS